MLSVLTVKRIGVNKGLADQTQCIKMFHSSPEGEELIYLINIFIHKYQLWESININFNEDRDIAILQDTNGDLNSSIWKAQHVVYKDTCFVES